MNKLKFRNNFVQHTLYEVIRYQNQTDQYNADDHYVFFHGVPPWVKDAQCRNSHCLTHMTQTPSGKFTNKCGESSGSDQDSLKSFKQKKGADCTGALFFSEFLRPVRTHLKNVDQGSGQDAKRFESGAVITSYSIHYTKLYDIPPLRRRRGNHAGDSP